MEPHPSSYPGGTSNGRYRDDVDRYNREIEYEEQRKQEEQNTWDEYHQRRQGGQNREDGHHQRRKEEQRRKEKARRDKANSRRRPRAAENSSKQSKSDIGFNVLGFVFEVFKALILGIFSFVFGAIKLLVSLAVIVFIALVVFLGYYEENGAYSDNDYPVQSDDDSLNQSNSNSPENSEFQSRSYPAQSDYNSPAQRDDDSPVQSNSDSPESTRNDTSPYDTERNRLAEILQSIGQAQPSEEIESLIEDSSVNFQSGQFQASGDVTWADRQEDSSNPANEGIAARIRWDDNVISTILFRDNNIVRVWESGDEYRGRWPLDSGVLRVQMDEGGKYIFDSD